MYFKRDFYVKAYSAENNENEWRQTQTHTQKKNEQRKREFKNKSFNAKQRIRKRFAKIIHFRLNIEK